MVCVTTPQAVEAKASTQSASGLCRQALTELDAQPGGEHQPHRRGAAAGRPAAQLIVYGAQPASRAGAGLLACGGGCRDVLQRVHGAQTCNDEASALRGRATSGGEGEVAWAVALVPEVLT